MLSKNKKEELSDGLKEELMKNLAEKDANSFYIALRESHDGLMLVVNLLSKLPKTTIKKFPTIFMGYPVIVKYVGPIKPL